LLTADYRTGSATTGTRFRNHIYTHDPAGNRRSESLALNEGTAFLTEYKHNKANQIIKSTIDGGTTWNVTYQYDLNGNLTRDGANRTYSYDRANRLLSHNNSIFTEYVYNGDGQRVQQTASAVVTDYLLDIQPGLSKVIAAKDGVDVTRFVHAFSGIFAQEDPAGEWSTPVQDALSSVRMQLDDGLDIDGMRHFDPYGTPFGEQIQTAFEWTPFGYTGEPTDDNGLVHLRARYYNPELGTFTALDPFEGLHDRPMSLNGYSYAHGNPVMNTDPSGEFLGLGAVIGTAIGAAIGAVGAAGFRALALSGKCGCDLKEKAKNTSLFDTMLTGALVGGGAALAMMGLGGLIGAGYTAAVGGGIGLGFSVSDMIKNGINACNGIAAALSVGGGLHWWQTANSPWESTYSQSHSTYVLQFAQS
jgi:RHS repeat-associated protein